MRNLLIIFLSVGLLWGFGSCKKDDGPDQEIIDQELIEEYIAENNLTTNVSESGLHYIIYDEGDTANMPYYYSYIIATYKGYLLDGTVFDAGDQQLEVQLGQLVPGWIEGLSYIGEGGKIKLIIPSRLGYGGIEKVNIPEYSCLVFDVELLQVYN